jgi:hypothetical protein
MMANPKLPAMPVEDQLAWEERQRPRAAAVALFAGLLAIGGLVVAGLSTRRQPPAFLLDSLHNLEQPGPIGPRTTVHVADFQYSTTHSGPVLLSIVMLALGLVGVGLSVSFIARCTRARRERFPRFAMPAAFVGATVIGIGIVVVYLAQKSFHSDVLAGTRTVDAVRNRPTAEGVGYTIELLGIFLFALGSIITCLNAMRVGLLTRTMGILGMFSGGAIVLFGPSQPLLPLWTAFLAPLFLGRWMGGQPPAWKTGKAEPWPSSQQLREERQRARGQLSEPDPEPVERAAAAKPHPSSKKRKRKRRA